VISAKGNYPKGTPVQHVAHYQNDGTATIKAAHFVEDAVERNDGWKDIVFESVSKYLAGNEWKLDLAGLRIAHDIRDAVNRIKTGQLKSSFRHETKEK